MHRRKQTEVEVKGPGATRGGRRDSQGGKKELVRGRDSELPLQVNTEMKRKGGEEIVKLLQQGQKVLIRDSWKGKVLRDGENTKR